MQDPIIQVTDLIAGTHVAKPISWLVLVQMQAELPLLWPLKSAHGFFSGALL